jgi:hypothetical protein
LGSIIALYDAIQFSLDGHPLWISDLNKLNDSFDIIVALETSPHARLNTTLANDSAYFLRG